MLVKKKAQVIVLSYGENLFVVDRWFFFKVIPHDNHRGNSIPKIET